MALAADRSLEEDLCCAEKWTSLSSGLGQEGGLNFGVSAVARVVVLILFSSF